MGSVEQGTCYPYWYLGAKLAFIFRGTRKHNRLNAISRGGGGGGGEDKLEKNILF